MVRQALTLFNNSISEQKDLAIVLTSLEMTKRNINGQSLKSIGEFYGKHYSYISIRIRKSAYCFLISEHVGGAIPSEYIIDEKYNVNQLRKNKHFWINRIDFICNKLALSVKSNHNIPLGTNSKFNSVKYLNVFKYLIETKKTTNDVAKVWNINPHEVSNAVTFWKNKLSYYSSKIDVPIQSSSIHIRTIINNKEIKDIWLNIIELYKLNVFIFNCQG